jgi:NAD-dependent deacetylase
MPVSDRTSDLRDLINAAARICVFTGAGISTESGIPDFRSPGGVWSKMQPIYFQDFVAREEARREAWGRVFSGAAGWVGKQPNAGHYAVARLVERGKCFAVITQNVDNLHQDSGVPDESIVELHGNASYAKCLECGERHEIEELRPVFVDRGEIPTCRACGGLVKTATISFGQPMPEFEMAMADTAARQCDLFLVAGSSLVVTPAATFPVIAKRSGAKLVILNREETPLDDYADLIVNDEIGPVLTAVVPTNS